MTMAASAWHGTRQQATDDDAQLNRPDRTVLVIPGPPLARGAGMSMPAGARGCGVPACLVAHRP